MNLFAKALVLVVGAWLIAGGGLCALDAGFSPWALVGIGFAGLGIWIIRIVFRPLAESERAAKDKG